MKIIFAETHYWDSGPRVDSHHLAMHMARRGHDVLYLSSPVSALHFLQGRNFSHKWRRAVHYGGRGQVVQERLRALVPLTWAPVQPRSPFDSDQQLERMLRWTTPQLERTIRDLGFGRPEAVIIQSLFFAHLPRMFTGVPIFYRMTDDFNSFPGMPRSLLAAEKNLVRQARLVTVTARRLMERARSLDAPRVEMLAHGVDSEFFAGACRPGRPRRVVYVGAIDRWFDSRMVAAAAQAVPEAEFVLAGPVGPAADLSAVRGMKNVRIAGPVQHDRLPELFAQARVGIIPFHRTPLIESVSPLKMLEYLAAGLSVISTRWSELENMNAPATLVDTPEAFAQAVAQGLNRELNEEGIKFAAGHSWSSRAELLETFIQSIAGRD